MGYNVFIKKDEKILSIIDVLIVVILIISLIIIMLGFSGLFKVVSIFNLVLLIIKSLIAEKDNIIKNYDKVVIDKPIVIDNDSIYLLQDKLSRDITLVSILCFFMWILFDSSGNMLSYFLINMGIMLWEVGIFLKKCNIKVLKIKNKENNLYSIINCENIQYCIKKVEKITKTEKGTYILTYDNSVSKEVIFTRKYENYNELVNLLNQKCS